VPKQPVPKQLVIQYLKDPKNVLSHLKQLFAELQIQHKTKNNTVVIINCNETVTKRIQDTLTAMHPTNCKTWIHETFYGWNTGYCEPRS
jgi:serine/threonine protein phosphatase PrpC